MEKGKQFKWKTAQPPRAPHIPEKLWEQHKDTIVREYREGGPKHAALCMKELTGLPISERQIRHRFRKPEGKWAEELSQSEASLNASTSSTVHSSPGGHDTASTQGSTQPDESSIHDCINVTSASSLLEHKGQQSGIVGLFAAQSKGGPVQQALKRRLSLETLPIDIGPKKQRHNPCSQSPSTSSKHPFEEDQGSSPSESSSSAGNSILQEQPESRIGLVSEHTRSLALPVSNQEPLQIISQVPGLFQDEEHYGFSKLEFDLDWPVQSWSASQIDLMARAANASFNLSHSKYAFEVYLSISEFWASKKDAAAERLALTACARSAVTDSQLEIASKLMAEKFSNKTCHDLSPTEALEKVRVSMILADICCRRNKYDLAWLYVNIAHRTYDFARTTPRGKVAFDIITYSHIHSCVTQVAFADVITSQDRNRELGDLHRLFSFQSRGNDQIGIELPTIVHSLWTWSANQLEHACLSPQLYRKISDSSEILKQVAFIAVYYCLWQAWNQTHNDPPIISSAELESALGIPMEEVLAVFSSMMTEEVNQQAESQTYATEHGLDDGRKFLEQASSKGRILSTLSESEFFRWFVDTFVQHNEVQASSSADKRYSYPALPVTKSLVENTLGITFKTRPARQKSQKPAQSWASCYNDPAQAPAPFPAVSLNLTSLSTLQKSSQNVNSYHLRDEDVIMRHASDASYGFDPTPFGKLWSEWSSEKSFRSKANRIKLFPPNLMHEQPVPDVNYFLDALSETFSNMGFLDPRTERNEFSLASSSGEMLSGLV